LPKITDGTRQNAIEITGSVSGGNFSDIRITANWVDLHRKDISPPLGLTNNHIFTHSFPIGGQKCGYVVFTASGKISNVTFDTVEKNTFVDCTPPRVLVGKPVDGQMIKAGETIPVEVRLEDDSMTHSVARSVGLVYPFKIDVDGQTAVSHDLYLNSYRTQPITFNVRIPDAGRHGIRVTLADPTGKSGEKTVWVNADGTPPAVSIISPAANERVTVAAGSIPSISVTVEASDAGTITSGIDKVEFYLDDRGVAVARSSSGGNRYVGTFGVTEGQKRIRVRALDKAGNAAEVTVNITVAFAGKTMPMGPLPTGTKTLPR